MPYFYLTYFASFVRAFHSRVASRTRDHGELLHYLEQYTTGTQKELVRSCVHMSPVAGYMEARRKLDMRYGDPFLLAQSYLKELDTWPAIRADRKYKDYVYRKMLVQEYLKKIKNI